MAVGDSIVSIVNTGLIALGEDPITDIAQNVKSAIVMKASYDPARRHLLGLHPWRFAKKLANLAANATAPSFKYANAFDLPSDFIRMYTDEDESRPDWEVMGGQILSDDTPPLQIVYVWNLTDPNRFSAQFSYVLGLELAVRCARALTGDAPSQTLILQRDSALSTARTSSAQQASAAEWDGDVLLAARF